ncbi:hypothetical protein K503DRAFT_342133 [Rhizopogon vinicolor AM-OR11-026]|uniref:Uncharacterized protein n=1 Tax=Rhizopogon vinicolor AM-OR11-026 TaxID=1314800 RepID=A0A1B7NCK1_9AGAM|nr:hypothetical protein K503DRAFT_342133 [Rhizopogon vinicolor AM-OR11-026]
MYHHRFLGCCIISSFSIFSTSAPYHHLPYFFYFLLSSLFFPFLLFGSDTFSCPSPHCTITGSVTG